jgi:hypothetical protein
MALLCCSKQLIARPEGSRGGKPKRTQGALPRADTRNAREFPIFFYTKCQEKLVASSSNKKRGERSSAYPSLTIRL